MLGFSFASVVSVSLLALLSIKSLHKLLFYSQDLVAASSAMSWISLLVGGLTLLLPDAIAYLTSNDVCLIFGLTAIIKLPKILILTECASFLVLSSVLWSIYSSDQYHGVEGVSITVGYIKVIASGLLAAFVQDLTACETFLVGRSLNRALDRLDMQFLKDLQNYISEKFIDTGEYAFSIFNLLVANGQVLRPSFSVRNVWYEWIDLRFKSRELEAEFRTYWNHIAIRQHIATTIINVMSAAVPIYLDTVEQASGQSAPALWSTTVQLAFFGGTLMGPCLLLLIKDIRTSPLAVQMIIFFASSANIAGWAVMHVGTMLAHQGDTGIAIFHQSLAALTISIISVSAQSGLLSTFFLPVLLVVAVANCGCYWFLSFANFQYQVTAIPETCLVAYYACISSEFESRRCFVVRKLRKIDSRECLTEIPCGDQVQKDAEKPTTSSKFVLSRMC
ncbi:uncharacterized protein BJ171DRAFT_535074 [Polychytrium aggregatum]|uniref:uncharacterized protein n=1 Tax=Polychytrium aggregatum TaxID=110093 RepID=UPI0022FE20A9|nr:uncharacterized protein BJ171DRAFT_535074 [Polychytrium aggregatum]KAI9193031.1 hypothetical protein BJ171DRAFT_535074 [Polychytrium aggregatum]